MGTIYLTPDEAIHDVGRIADIAAKGDFSRTLRGPVERQFYGGVADRFDEQASPENISWAELKYRTEPPPKLVLTGKMKTAATGGQGSIAEIQARAAKWSIDEGDVPYAVFHMTGTRIMPARPFFGITEEVKDAIANTLGDAMDEKAG